MSNGERQVANDPYGALRACKLESTYGSLRESSSTKCSEMLLDEDLHQTFWQEVSTCVWEHNSVDYRDYNNIRSEENLAENPCLLILGKYIWGAHAEP